MTNFFHPQENDKIRKEQAEVDIECNRVKDRLVLLEELVQELQTRNGELESHVQMLNEQLQQRDVKLQTVSNVNSNSGGDELATLRDENLQLRGKNAQLKDDMVYLQHLVPENNRLKDQLAQLQQVQTINGALEHEMKLLQAQLQLVTEEKSKMQGRNSRTTFPISSMVHQSTHFPLFYFIIVHNHLACCRDWNNAGNFGKKTKS